MHCEKFRMRRKYERKGDDHTDEIYINYYNEDYVADDYGNDEEKGYDDVRGV
jgi:hypothetical protein